MRQMQKCHLHQDAELTAPCCPPRAERVIHVALRDPACPSPGEVCASWIPAQAQTLLSPEWWRLLGGGAQSAVGRFSAGTGGEQGPECTCITREGRGL